MVPTVIADRESEVVVVEKRWWCRGNVTVTVLVVERVVVLRNFL